MSSSLGCWGLPDEEKLEYQVLSKKKYMAGFRG